MKYMLKRVIDAKYIKDYRIWLKFNDGKSGEIDLAEKISWGEVFEPLRQNINFFKNFKIVGSTIAWENEADLAPESLYELLKQQNQNKK